MIKAFILIFLLWLIWPLCASKNPLILLKVSTETFNESSWLFHRNILYHKYDGSSENEIGEVGVAIQCKLPNWYQSTGNFKFEWTSLSESPKYISYEISTTDIVGDTILFNSSGKTVEEFQCTAKHQESSENLNDWEKTPLLLFRHNTSALSINFENDTFFNDTHHPTILSCDCSKVCSESNATSFFWILNGKNITNSEFYNISEGVLQIRNASRSLSGIYVCVSTESENFVAFQSIEGPPGFAPPLPSYSRRPEGKETMEDGSVSLPINVDVYGNPMQKLVWIRRKENRWTGETHDETINEAFFEKYPSMTRRIQFYPTVYAENGMLEIIDLVFDDRAYYIVEMTAEYSYREEKATYIVALVRVRGKLDALWLAIGIVVMLIMLVFVIYFCEKRRLKQQEKLLNAGIVKED